MLRKNYPMSLMLVLLGLAALLGKSASPEQPQEIKTPPCVPSPKSQLPSDCVGPGRRSAPPVSLAGGVTSEGGVGAGCRLQGAGCRVLDARLFPHNLSRCLPGPHGLLRQCKQN